MRKAWNLENKEHEIFKLQKITSMFAPRIYTLKLEAVDRSIIQFSTIFWCATKWDVLLLTCSTYDKRFFDEINWLLECMHAWMHNSTVDLGNKVVLWGCPMTMRLSSKVFLTLRPNFKLSSKAVVSIHVIGMTKLVIKSVIFFSVSWLF